ncbi:ATP5C1 [Symbiodinium pilosum]|uniref:ATP5C1 protein n=1 Tax=Symbiodinium pilosum TaxID=2952 RepID=A0A812R0L3_SYMPI|nr:ATP5C1 [Symbiodinium pilosum]
MGPMRQGRGEPSPATDRTDAPLIEGKDAKDAEDGRVGEAAAAKVNSGSGAAGSGSSSLLTKALEVARAARCLPAPPGGWLGPFGFFRLVTYVFLAGAVFAVLLTVTASVGLGIPLVGGGPDGFAAFASLLLCFACLVCAGAAYAHEGLEQEVTAMQKQNQLFQDKNQLLAAQLDELSGVRQKLEDVRQRLGEDLEHFEATLVELHAVSSVEVLQLMLEAFLNADDSRDGRLADEELDRFFEVCKAPLQQAAPDFDVEQLVEEVQDVGLGLCNLRFLTNAAVAGCDRIPGRSTAMLALVMFSTHPEKYEHELAISLKSVLGSSDDVVAAWIQDKKAKADPQEHGRIPGHELMDLSRMVMSAPLEAKDSTGEQKEEV